MLEDLDLDDFWEDSEHAREHYIDAGVTDALVESVERELGFKLPAAYIALMRSQNGGYPKRDCFPADERTSWAEDHIAITGIMGIGRDKMYSLLGERGSRFMQAEWGYPTWGVCVCDCPSAGHDMVMLDYRECGPNGEPSVVHVDQEAGFRVTTLAPDFGAFVRGLVAESEFNDDQAELDAAIERVTSGSFSTALAEALARLPDVEPALRRLLRALIVERGYFALHADSKSHLVYDIIFDAYSRSTKITTAEAFLDAYEDLIAFGDGGVTTGGYAPGFIREWLERRVATGAVVSREGALVLSDEQRARVGMLLAPFR